VSPDQSQTLTKRISLIDKNVEFPVTPTDVRLQGSSLATVPHFQISFKECQLFSPTDGHLVVSDRRFSLFHSQPIEPDVERVTAPRV